MIALALAATCMVHDLATRAHACATNKEQVGCAERVAAVSVARCLRSGAVTFLCGGMGGTARKAQWRSAHSASCPVAASQGVQLQGRGGGAPARILRRGAEASGDLGGLTME